MWLLDVDGVLNAVSRGPVWTDDDLVPLADQLGDLAGCPDALLLGPDRAVGLTPEHLDRIREFLGLDVQPAPRRRRLGRLLSRR